MCMRRGSDKTNAIDFSVVIIEDSEVLLDLYQMSFDDIGERKNINFSVDVYNSAHDFINTYHQKKYNLAIVDWVFPEKEDGRDICEKILSDEIAENIFVCSGYADNPKVLDYCLLRHIGAVPKPVQEEELSKIISKVIERLPCTIGKK